MNKLYFLLGSIALGAILPMSALDAALVEGTPNLYDFQNVAYSSNFACVRNNNVCYYCGSDSACGTITGCASKIKVNTGSYQVIGSAAIGCLGTSFCIVPRNGFYMPKDGVFGASEYMFYTSIRDEAGHCNRPVDMATCTSWNSAPATYNSYPFCRCDTANSQFGQGTCVCDNGYWRNSTNGCDRCPSMVDKHGATQYGDTSSGATAITQCQMSSTYEFEDATGDFHFDRACAYSE